MPIIQGFNHTEGCPLSGLQDRQGSSNPVSSASGRGRALRITAASPETTFISGASTARGFASNSIGPCDGIGFTAVAAEDQLAPIPANSLNRDRIAGPDPHSGLRRRTVGTAETNYPDRDHPSPVIAGPVTVSSGTNPVFGICLSCGMGVELP